MLGSFGATREAADGMLAMIAAQDQGIYEAELGPTTRAPHRRTSASGVMTS